MRPAFVLSLAGLLIAGLAWACSVPVFRYALERWRHDKRDELYRVTVFHKGELSDDHLATLRVLDPTHGPRANWLVEAVDLNGLPSPDQTTFWEQQKSPELPWVVVRVPELGGDKTPPLYQGPLDRAALLAWIDSPARRTIARKLLQGDSVVWLLVESGEKDRDDAVAEQVSKELTRLQGAIKLPEQDEDVDSALKSKVPLRIAFPLVRLSRQAAGEEAYLRQLLTLDEDHTQAKGPILFPIFGRGRMLTGFTEKEITRKNLDEAARFLCGACSCRVKMANPGVDLLWSADWDSILAEKPPVASEEPTPPEPIPLTRKPVEEARPAEEPKPETGWGRSLLLGGISAAAALVLVMGWLALRLSRGT
jgi:hypothetical protein